MTTYALGAFALDRYGLRSVPDRAFDAIVVAGCRVMPDGEPSVALRRRVEHAVALYHDGRAPLLAFTGGVGDHGPSEASVGARLARELGVPAAAIVTEERSTSTDENAAHIAEALGADRRVLVVSDAYHVFRCERVFGRYFAEVRGSGTRGHPYARVKGALREVAAVVIYAALGRL